MYVGNLCHSYETCEPLVSTVCIISMVMFHSKLLNDHRANAYDDIFLFTSTNSYSTLSNTWCCNNPLLIIDIGKACVNHL